MDGNDTDFAALVNEDGGDRMKNRTGRMNGARKAPAADTYAISRKAIRVRRRKDPPTVMIWSIPPRLVAEPAVAKSGIPNPLATGERRPSEPGAEGAPAET